jgi:Zn-dependent peptidase ImmA (M78 family)
MKHLLHGLERHGIGRRALTEIDFERICAREGVDIFWSDRRYALYYTPTDDVKIIILPKRLTGPELLFAQFHELAHYLLHGGDDPCVAFLGQSDRKCEAEADAVALVSIFPTVEQPPLMYSRFVRKLWDDRLALYFNYGIE